MNKFIFAMLPSSLAFASPLHAATLTRQDRVVQLQSGPKFCSNQESVVEKIAQCEQIVVAGSDDAACNMDVVDLIRACECGYMKKK